MKEVLLTILRDKRATTGEFRWASDQLAQLLCAETLAKLVEGQARVETPVGWATGRARPGDVMVVAIMRAALALLPAFTQAMPDLPVGIMGIERDEQTAQAAAYYQKLPPVLPRRAIVLDPMLATGGSACLAVEALLKEGYLPPNLYFTGVVAAQEGLQRLSQIIPAQNITVAAIDPDLNERKFIAPRLGDYGDRYYGT